MGRETMSLTLLLEHMPHGLVQHEIHHDDDGKPLYCSIHEVNTAFESMMGLDREAMLGKPTKEILGSESPDWLSIYTQIVETGETLTLEWFRVSTKCWYEITAFSGEEGFLITLFRDCTATKEKEQHLQDLMENSPDMVVRLNDRLEHTYCTRSVEDQWGIPPGESLGKTCVQLPVPRAVKEFMVERHAMFQKSLETGERLEFEQFFAQTYLLTTVVPEKNTEGEVVSLLAITRDYTEQKKAEEELRIREERLEKMLDVIPDMVSIHDPAMNIMYSNWQGFAAVPAEKRVLGSKCYRTYRGYDAICPDCQAQAVFASKKPIQDQVLLPEGRWVDVRVLPILNAQGDVEFFVEWVQDISRQKQMEQDLKEQNTLLEGVLDGVSDILAIQYPDYTIDRYNKAGYEALGCEEGEVQNKTCYELLGRQKPCERCATRLALQTKKQEQLEKFVPELGIYLDCRSNPILDEEGQVIRIVEQLRDITEQKEQEEKLIESEKRLNTLMAQTPAVIYSFIIREGKPQLTYINRNIENILGYRAEDFIDNTEFWLQCVHEEDRRQLSGKLQGEEGIHEYRFKDKGGSYRWLLDRQRVLREEEEYKEIIGVLWDNTHGKEAEKALKESEERYRQIFEESPLALWECDFSEVKKKLNELQREYDNIEEYLTHNRTLARELLEMVEVVDMNPATLELYGARDKEDFFSDEERLFGPGFSSGLWDSFLAIAGNQVAHSSEEIHNTLQGVPIQVQMHWSVVPGHEDTYSRVLVSVVDITALKETEKSLQDTKQKVEGLHETALVMAQSHDIDDICDLILQAAVQILGYNRCAVFIKEDKELLCKRSNTSSEQIIPSYPEMAKQSLSQGKTCVFGGKSREKSAYVQEGPGPSVLSTPLGDMGVFQVILYDGRTFSPEDQRLIELIANHGGEALKRLRFEKDIRYVSFHDSLTSLYNRHYMEEEMRRLDTERQLPLGLIMVDVNGLKIINDTYGHEKGDSMLACAGSILKKACREEDIIARWGGDEFVILLPQTHIVAAQGIQKRIMAMSQDVFVQDIPLSLSVGIACKETGEEDITDVLKRAEDQMYRHKLTESRSAKSAALAALLRTLATKSYETEAHTRRMQEIARIIGKRLGLPDSERDRLELLITLHDIGKINISEKILTKKGPLTQEEWKIMETHPEIGHRIAKATPEFAHVAEDILSHHERWDGRGYPRGIQGKAIPLLARIAAVVDAYEVMSNGRPYKEPMGKEEIIREFQRCAGGQFDPEIARIMIESIQ